MVVACYKACLWPVMLCKQHARHRGCTAGLMGAVQNAKQVRRDMGQQSRQCSPTLFV